MRLTRLFPLTLLLAVVAAACAAEASTSQPADGDPAGANPTPRPDTEGATAPAATSPAEQAPPSPLPTAVSSAGDSDGAARGEQCVPDGVSFSARYWPDTDFCQHSVDYSEIFSGGPPPDGIPAIDEPKFVAVAEADSWLQDAEPVIQFREADDVRAYPLQILIWHEIANDVVGGRPVAVTFCPLCNATIVFDREVDGQVLDFGTSGNLRNSDLIMYDRQTRSWWQQFTGEAIVGELTGAQLEFLPASIVAWADFKEEFPDGLVLSQDTGFGRSYGRNPYVGYDRIDQNPFLFFGPSDGRLPAMARVAAVEVGETFVAYPFDVLGELQVVNDTQSGLELVVFWKAGTASALDGSDIAVSRDVGSTAIFSRTVDGQTLTFRPTADGLFVDSETGSTWNIFGEAVGGALAGSQLEQLVSHEYFWFAWAAFRPDTLIYSSST